MTLLETIEVPISSSRVCGLEMGKHFNHIGWLSVTPNGMVDISFQRSPTRVSGGPPNRIDRTGSLGFAKLVADSGGLLSSERDDAWFEVVTHAQMLEMKKK